VLTLFSTPVVYYYLDRMRRRFSAEAPAHPHRGPGAPAAAKELTLGGE